MTAVPIKMPGARQPELWTELRAEARRIVASEPTLAAMLERTIFAHADLGSAISAVLAGKLAGDIRRETLEETFHTATDADPDIVDGLAADLKAVRERDPATSGVAQPFLFFKGFQALQAHRLAHHFWRDGRTWLALHLQSAVSERFGVDIHPAARVGRGILIDHGTGLVVGETAVIGDNVSILQNVTLGGTGKEAGDRHPKVRNGVLIGAGAKILGNLEVGMCAKIGAGSVVLQDVPPFATVAGVPARVIGKRTDDVPAHGMDHRLPETGFVEHGAFI